MSNRRSRGLGSLDPAASAAWSARTPKRSSTAPRPGKRARTRPSGRSASRAASLPAPSTAEINPEYRVGGGSIRLALSDVDFSEPLVRTKVSAGLGNGEVHDHMVFDGLTSTFDGSHMVQQASRVSRELGIVFFNRMVSLITRTHVTDCSNGYRAVRASVLPQLVLRQEQFHTSEFMIEAIKRGIPAKEVPVTVVARLSGHSKKPAVVRYEQADAETLDAELRAYAAPLLAGAYPVAAVPHRGLCATCPGRAGLCSYPPELTDRELARELA